VIVEGLDVLDARIMSTWQAPRRLRLSEWADEHFVLPSDDANAGRWSTLPYQRGVMDAITDPGVERVTWKKSSRVGYTKCFCAAIGYFIDHDPCPILVVQPTIDEAKKHSKEDIAPMIAEVPVLRGKVSEAKSRNSENTINDKRFSGGSLSLVGANSPRGFRRTSRRVVIFDEVDGYPASAGNEGDPIKLGIRRTEYYWNRKILAGSTPTIDGHSKIDELFGAGDQRRYYVPCPECGELQVLKMKNLRWPEGQPALAYFVCEVNGCEIQHREKRGMIEAGEWRAEKPEHFTEHNRHASFHIWAAYSYSPNATWGQIAAEFIEANRGGPETLQAFVNTVLGETWAERGEAPAWEPLYKRREEYAQATVPRRALFLTAGVDVQKDRLVYEVVGWGRGKESWSVDYATLPGETADLVNGPWKDLDALLARAYPHANGVELAIRTLAVDSGYNTSQVYTWARRYPMSRVIAIKGQETGGVLVSAPSPVDVTIRGKKLKRGYKVWPVSGGVAKSELYAWLRLEAPLDDRVAPPPGFCHFPQWGEAYFRELTAEQLVRVRTRRGFMRLEWTLIPGRRNEVLDARVYARAAATVVGIDRFTESDWLVLEASVGAEEPDDQADVDLEADELEAGAEPATIAADPVPRPSPPPPAPRPIRTSSWLGDRGRGWLRR
jgi:phage terminase large subunit GpA-like protein